MSAHHAIEVSLGEQSYDICISYGLAQHLSSLLSSYNNGQQWVVLTQQTIVEHYQRLIDKLRDDGYRLAVITVPDNESAKNINHAEQVWTKMVASGCDRSSILLALGGGVVGDLGGFVAATYMRGIPVIQIPTTLLAMIDSSIGGKTAINLKAGKNLVGVIYQPKKVIIDPAFLATLPQRNVISSLGEAVKYGLIRDKDMFHTINQRFEELLGLQNQQLLTDIIINSCQIKSEIVANDQFEHGERRLLNYGHTIGHALETIQAYGGLYHGEAVFYGMKCANYISWQKKLLSDDDYYYTQGVLDKFPLPKLGEVNSEKVLEIICYDKKNINGQLNFVLLDGIGHGVISTEVSRADIVDSLAVISV